MFYAAKKTKKYSEKNKIHAWNLFVLQNKSFFSSQKNALKKTLFLVLHSTEPNYENISFHIKLKSHMQFFLRRLLFDTHPYIYIEFCFRNQVQMHTYKKLIDSMRLFPMLKKTIKNDQNYSSSKNGGNIVVIWW